jgi:hypothetical protein
MDVISGEHLFTNESNLHPRSKQTYTTVQTAKWLRRSSVALRCGGNQTPKTLRYSTAQYCLPSDYSIAPYSTYNINSNFNDKIKGKIN